MLALYAPFGGNTPTEFLFKDVGYDTDTLALFDSSKTDVIVARRIDLVVNLISDADQAEAVLPMAARWPHRLGKPVINDPARISRTTRDAVTDCCRASPAAAFRTSCVCPPARRLGGRARSGSCRSRSRCWRGPRARMAATISRSATTARRLPSSSSRVTAITI